MNYVRSSELAVSKFRRIILLMVWGALIISVNVSLITAKLFNGFEFSGLTWSITNLAFPTGSGKKELYKSRNLPHYSQSEIKVAFALLSHNTLKWSVILGHSFFAWCWWPRESVLRGSSGLSEFHTSLSKVPTLWHYVKVKQRYLKVA